MYPEHDKLLLFTPDIKCPFFCTEIEVLKKDDFNDYSWVSMTLQIVLPLLAVLCLVIFCFWLWKKSNRTNDAQDQVMYSELQSRELLSSPANLVENICEDFNIEGVDNKDNKVQSSDEQRCYTIS